jgi:Ring hydroxylating alpha subunit (catalytic domain)
LACNWKVYVDNYLDGGYHVPHLHKGLSSVLDYKEYTIEISERYSLQSSPMVSSEEHASFAATRTGNRAYYYWLYPNFMINIYEGVMDTNLVLPLTTDRCLVQFDFFFKDVSDGARIANKESVAVSDAIQDEDVDICESVQRGLRSRSYGAGRLSVRREGWRASVSSTAGEGSPPSSERGGLTLVAHNSWFSATRKLAVPPSTGDKSPNHSANTAGREIFELRSSGRLTGNTEVTSLLKSASRISSGLPTNRSESG